MAALWWWRCGGGCCCVASFHCCKSPRVCLVECVLHAWIRRHAIGLAFSQIRVATSCVLDRVRVACHVCETLVVHHAWVRRRHGGRMVGS